MFDGNETSRKVVSFITAIFGPLGKTLNPQPPMVASCCILSCFEQNINRQMSQSVKFLVVHFDDST